MLSPRESLWAHLFFLCFLSKLKLLRETHVHSKVAVKVVGKVLTLHMLSIELHLTAVAPFLLRGLNKPNIVFSIKPTGVQESPKQTNLLFICISQQTSFESRL